MNTKTLLSSLLSLLLAAPAAPAWSCSLLSASNQGIAVKTLHNKAFDAGILASPNVFRVPRRRRIAPLWLPRVTTNFARSVCRTVSVSSSNAKVTGARGFTRRTAARFWMHALMFAGFVGRHRRRQRTQTRVGDRSLEARRLFWESPCCWGCCQKRSEVRGTKKPKHLQRAMKMLLSSPIPSVPR